MTNLRVALVTGANRGLGLEISRQLAKQGFHVILGSRHQAKGQAASEALRAEGFNVTSYPVAVDEEKSLQEVCHWIQAEFGRLDVLINNAGVMLDRQQEAKATALQIPLEVVRETLETNTLGAFRLAQLVIPLMQQHHYGRIVNVSSELGQLHQMQGGWPAYRLSKVALNAVTRMLAHELKGSNILVNSMCPGWTQTDMGGANAPRSVTQGADTMLWLATLPDGGPTGKFFQDRRELPW